MGASSDFDIRSPSEAVLIKALGSAGEEGQEVQMTLVLPKEAVQKALVPSSRLRALEARSGSQVRLGVAVAPRKAASTQLVTITGTSLCNALAVLHLQDLLVK